MSRFTRQICVAAAAFAVVAPAAGAAVYQHSPGIAQTSSAATTYAHSPGLNAYRHLEAFNPAPSTPAVSVTTTSSFHWADAGIGAGALAAVLLLAGATAMVVRKAGDRRLAV